MIALAWYKRLLGVSEYEPAVRIPVDADTKNKRKRSTNTVEARR